MNSIKKEINKFYYKIFYFILSNYINIFRTTILYISGKDKQRKKKISLLCPSRQRVKKTDRFLDSLYKTTENLENLEVLILLDEEEKFYPDYKNLIEKYNNIKDIIKINSKTLLTNPERMNYLSSISSGEIILPCNDDMIFLTNKWDNLLCYEFSKADINEPFSVWLRCDRKYTYFDASAFPAINRYWLEKLGYLSPSQFKNWYQDTWICDLGRRTHLFIISKHIKVKQFHALHYKEEIDDTHLKNHTKQNIEYDDHIWINTKTIRKKDAKKLVK